MAKREEIGFRDELIWLIYSESFSEVVITVAGGAQYVINNPNEIGVGESVVSVARADGSYSIFRLLQISNIDAKTDRKRIK